MAIGLFDSLRNWVTSMGTTKDPVRAAEYAFVPLDRGQLENAYRGDWIARKVVDIPARDATREWRAWKATQDQIKKIEEAERALGVQGKTKQSIQKSRLYGGAAMVMGVNVGTESEELKVESVGQGDLKFVHVCAAHELTCGPVIDDVTSPWYGEPEFYSRVGAVTARIHPSRVVRFVGSELPDRTITTVNGQGWGDSVLQIVDDAVRGAGLVTNGIASMISDCKVDVVKIPELTKRLQNADYRNNLTSRFTYANQAKSMLNALVIDSDEEWQRIQTSFSALPDLLKMYLLVASGAAHIPATIMLGQSAQGLNATGDNDVRNYYDRIKNEQATELQPTLKRLDDVLLRSALGTVSDEIHFEWNPLWQLTESEEADLAKKKADSAKVDADSGLVPIEALSAARVNQLIEDGTYPGLEEEVEKAEAAAEEAEFEEVDPELADPRALPAPATRALPAPGASRSRRQSQPGGFPVDSVADSMRRRLHDTRPRTLYLSRDMVNGAALIAWAREQGFTDLVDADELHVTIAYSKAAINWMELGEAWSQDERGRIKVAPGGPRVVEQLGDEGVVCLLFSNTNLQWRHGDVIRAGGSHDYPEYQPHVTFARSTAGVPNLDLVEPYQGELTFGPEVFQEVKRSGHSYTEAAE